LAKNISLAENCQIVVDIYRAFHGFGQDKFAYGGSILGSSHFTQLSQLLLKMTLGVKMVKFDFFKNNHIHLLIYIRDTLCSKQ